MRLFRRYGGNVGVMGGIDSDVVTWADQVVTNGGTVSADRKIIASIFVRSAKESGAWALTDDYWMLWGENEIQALTSLKQRRLAVATSSPTFTADRGYVFDGATNYIATGFIPNTHKVALSGTEQRLAAYERTNVNANTYSAGVSQSATSNMSLRAHTAGNAAGNLNSGNAVFSLPVATSAGFTAVSRTGGGTTMKGYKNGAAMTDATGLTVGTGLPTVELFIAAINNSGTPASFRAASMGMVSIGAPLSAAQELSQYNAVQAWATAIGAQV